MSHNSPAVDRQTVGGLNDRPFLVPKTTVVYIDGFNIRHRQKHGNLTALDALPQVIFLSEKAAGRQEKNPAASRWGATKKIG